MQLEEDYSQTCAGAGDWLRPRRNRKRGPVRNGQPVSKFSPNIPGRRRLASTKDGDWLVFVDSSDSHGELLFIYNKPLQFKVNLPRLNHPLESFFKCLIASCRIDGDGGKVQVCRYKICFLYCTQPSYVWNSNNLNYWQHQAYSNNPDELYADAVLSESSREEDDDDIAHRLFGITPFGLLCGPNLRIQLPNTSASFIGRRLVFKYSEEGNRLFLLERNPQTAWEAWEIDITQGSWVSTSLDGLVILIYGFESVVFSSCMLKPGLLAGNCIIYVNPKDRKTIFVQSLADHTWSIFENKPDSGFPVWSPSAMENWMPWWSFVEDNLHETATSEEPCKSVNETAPLCSDESRGLIKFYHNLPRELQSYIAESITSAMDYANFRLVSKKWSEIARPIRWIPDSSPESVQSPWFMEFQEKELCSIIDPSCNMKYYMSNQELLGCKIRYSKDGWLLVTKGTRKVFFLEPFTNTKISLPDIPEYFHPDGMSMSSSPTSSDWAIISTASLLHSMVVMYLRSVDEEWSIVEVVLNLDFEPSGSNLVFHDHKFYYLAPSGNMVVFWWELDVFKYHEIITADESGPLECGYTNRGYLVSCEDKYLYLVIFPPLGKGVRMYKLGVVKQRSSRWIEMKMMGKFSFFISHTSSLALPVSKRSQQNTINFPLFIENRHLSYKLDTREFRYCNSSGNYIVSTTKVYKRKELVVGTWLQPKVTRGYRPWKKAGCELELMMD